MFKVIPRSALAQSMPAAVRDPLRAGNPGTNATPVHLVLQQQVEKYKAALQKVAADRQRIVKEANAKLGALAGRVRQLEGFIKTGYAPVPQGTVPIQPSPALQNPYIRGTDGGQHVIHAQPFDPTAGNPRDAAGNPHDNAHPVHETVKMAEDAIFYGSGDAAFYEGGEGD